jgi:hypothetical protein
MTIEQIETANRILESIEATKKALNDTRADIQTDTKKQPDEQIKIFGCCSSSVSAYILLDALKSEQSSLEATLDNLEIELSEL